MSDLQHMTVTQLRQEIIRLGKRQKVYLGEAEIHERVAASHLESAREARDRARRLATRESWARIHLAKRPSQEFVR